MDFETFNGERGLQRLLQPFGPLRGRRLGSDEVLTEKACGIGVVVDAEHELASRRIQARSTAYHLVEGNR